MLTQTPVDPSFEAGGVRSALARTTLDDVCAADHDIATGVWPEMTEYGGPSDQWPAIFRRVLDPDILVLASPVRLGDNSLVMKRVIERLRLLQPYPTTRSLDIPTKKEHP